MVRLDSEKMSKSVGNVFMLGEALERHGPETLLMYFCGAHYRQPMEYDDERLAEARARAAGIRNTARGLVDGPSPEWSAPLRERLLRRARQRLQHAPGAGDRGRLGAGGQPQRRRARVGRADLREMLDVLGLAEPAGHRSLEPVSDEATALRDARERARQAA